MDDAEWVDALERDDLLIKIGALEEAIEIGESRIVHLMMENEALRSELVYVLEVAIVRGVELGFVHTDDDWLARWEELSGEEWIEEGDEE